MACVKTTSMNMESYAEKWTEVFFDEEHIVNTFQNLLHDTSQSVDDLCRLCLAACEDKIVLAMNVTGLMPFANNPEFVFPFAAMSHKQLEALRTDCKMLPDAMACEYDVDLYVLKIRQNNFEIDHSLLIFAAAVILYKGMSETKVLARGTCFPKFESNSDLLAHHANAILFQIVNSCNLKNGALRTSAQLLLKYGVGT